MSADFVAARRVLRDGTVGIGGRFRDTEGCGIMPQMDEDQSMAVPASFVALYLGPRSRVAPGQAAQIARRHEFCEDLAAACIETSRAMLHDLGIAESDVLERVHAGLLEPAAGVTPPEAAWVTRRLAEMLGWSWPADLDARIDPPPSTHP